MDYSFEWVSNGTEIASCNFQDIDRIMDSEDSAIIYSECDILSLIEKYMDENDLNDEIINKLYDIKELIQEKIEDDVISFAIPELL